MFTWITFLFSNQCIIKESSICIKGVLLARKDLCIMLCINVRTPSLPKFVCTLVSRKRSLKNKLGARNIELQPSHSDPVPRSHCNLCFATAFQLPFHPKNTGCKYGSSALLAPIKRRSWRSMLPFLTKLVRRFEMNILALIYWQYLVSTLRV